MKGFSITWTQSYGLAEFADGVLDLSLLEVECPKITMGFGEIVVESQSIPKGSAGRDQVPLPHVCQPDVIIGYFRVLIGGDLQGLTPLCYCIIPTSQLQIQTRQVNMGLGI